MRGFIQFCWRAIRSQPIQVVAGAAMTVAGVSYQAWIKEIWDNAPAFILSPLFQIAVIFLCVLLLAYVFYRQAEEESSDTEQVRRLRRKPDVTFGEISAVISQSNSAYSKDEVLHQLIKAVWNREFEEYSGDSRLRFDLRNQGGSRDHYLVRGYDALAVGVPSTVPQQDVQTELHRMIRAGPAAFNPGFVSSHIERLSVERNDFLRWYRRFKDGRYEH